MKGEPERAITVVKRRAPALQLFESSPKIVISVYRLHANARRPVARRLPCRPWRRIAAAVDRTSACTRPSRSSSSCLEIGTLRWPSGRPPAFHKQDQFALPFCFLLELKSLTKLQARQAKLRNYSSPAILVRGVTARLLWDDDKNPPAVCGHCMQAPLLSIFRFFLRGSTQSLSKPASRPHQPTPPIPSGARLVGSGAAASPVRRSRIRIACHTRGTTHWSLEPPL